MKQIQAVNDAGLLFAPLAQDLGDANRPGVICAANEARFDVAHLSEPLTGYIVGWRDPEDLATLLERIAPAAPVSRRFSYRLFDNAQAFLSESDDIRAIGAAFKRVEYTGTTAEGRTLNKGLTVRIDVDEDGAGLELEQSYARNLVQRVLRNDLRRAITGIDAASTNVAKTWNTTANPDSDMRAQVIAGRDACGLTASKVMISEAAWQLRLDAYEGKATTSAGYTAANAALQRDEAGLARYLGVDDVFQVKARYQSTASAKALVISSAVYSYYAMSGLTKEDPSNVKRFVSNTRSGTGIAVYREERGKFVDITVEHYSNIIVVSTLGMQKRTIS